MILAADGKADASYLWKKVLCRTIVAVFRLSSTSEKLSLSQSWMKEASPLFVADSAGSTLKSYLLFYSCLVMYPCFVQSVFNLEDSTDEIINVVQNTSHFLVFQSMRIQHPPWGKLFRYQRLV